MEKFVKKTAIKICGITRASEASFLNEAGVDYAGFVFYEKSRRNIGFEKAKEIMEALAPSIQKVAVCVSPTQEQIEKIGLLGVDILQIHGKLEKEVPFPPDLLFWRAVNLSGVGCPKAFFSEEPDRVRERTAGIVVDGADYGGGKPFDWEMHSGRIKRWAGGRTLILAGGLCAENVRRGIRLFSPDVVDVSSGVEGHEGKNREKIIEFVRKVREDEQ